MAYQIKTLKTGSNAILQPLWGIKRGSPTGMEAELRLFHPPSVLPPPLWTIFHSLRPRLPSPCWSKCVSWALSPWALPGQTRESNTHPHPRRERHPSSSHFSGGQSTICLKWSISHSVMSDPLRPHGLQPIRLLCSWNFPGKNTGVGSHSLLQGIFPTQGLNQVSCIAGRLFTIGATRGYLNI